MLREGCICCATQLWTNWSLLYSDNSSVCVDFLRPQVRILCAEWKGCKVSVLDASTPCIDSNSCPAAGALERGLCANDSLALNNRKLKRNP